jgi:prefoldin subunit 5
MTDEQEIDKKILKLEDAYDRIMQIVPETIDEVDIIQKKLAHLKRQMMELTDDVESYLAVEDFLKNGPKGIEQ